MAAIASAMESERDAAYADLVKMDCARNNAFHRSESGRSAQPTRCEMCE
jgi:hypothetical protein